MSTNKPSESSINAIAENVKALHALLADATRRIAEADELFEVGEFFPAVGAVVGLGNVLDEAKALYEAALALHRHQAR